MSIQEQEKDLRRKAQLYLEYNKDEKHSLVISQYLQENNFQKLKDLLCERLSFGTAGLRGSLGPGLNQMNSLVVLQTTQGVISVLHDQYNGSMENWKDFGVVIGYDHRHESRDFAHLISGSFIGKGIKVYLFRNFIHTPMIPFSVTRLKALCGIMITASHNPKNDNGYKLYWENGCQIIPPIDKKIANAILDNLKPWNWNPELATQSIDSEFLIQEYFSKISSLKSFDLGASKVSFCYTAMHGVGYPFAKKAFEVFGLGSKLVPVLEQVDPDPEFSTVVYPNPEEEGALNMAIKTATEKGCQIILANDPDADRLAVAERLPNGEWYVFNGNELGSILGSLTFENHKRKHPHSDNSKIVILASTVSCHFLEHFAEIQGLQFRETLSGFKWLGNEALKLKEKGLIPIFAFEEAIGYMIGDIVADKDGISSLAVLAENIENLYSENKTLLSYLNDLYKTYGLALSENGYFICYSPDKIKDIFTKFRFGEKSKKELSYPTKVGNVDILSIRDLTVGFDSSQPDNIPILPVSSSSQMITLKLSNGCLFTVRTSGTEPKIKYYSEIRGDDLDIMYKELHKTVKELIALILEPDANGLIPK